MPRPSTQASGQRRPVAASPARDAVENRREQVPRDRPWASWNVIDPFRYLADVPRRLPISLPDGLTELLPEVWFRAHLAAARNRAA